MTRLSTHDLSRLLNLSSRRVNQLVDSEIFPKPDKNGHDPFVCVPKYLQFLATRTAPKSLDAARTAKYAVDTALQELRLRREQGELVDRRAVDSILFTGNRRVRDNFLNLPARTDALVAAESDRQKCFDILTLEVRQILEGLTDGLQEDRDEDSHA